MTTALVSSVTETESLTIAMTGSLCWLAAATGGGHLEVAGQDERQRLGRRVVNGQELVEPGKRVVPGDAVVGELLLELELADGAGGLVAVDAVGRSGAALGRDR